MDLRQEINRLKKEKNALILAHNYQIPEIQEIADCCGDSLELSRRAESADCAVIVFCGVRFMAESAKILAPQKIVLLPAADAGCPMADMISAADLLALKKQHPGAMAVTYVNSGAEVKAVTDICCTSANAVKIVQKIDAPEIIFSPDRNLAAWCARFTDKKIIPWKGFCIVHEKIRAEDIIQAKKNHPEALFIAHPECRADVVDLADRVESTSGMLRFIKSSPVEKFIIGTEEGIITRLRQDSPGKSFFYPGTAPVCANMKKTRLEDVYNALEKMQHEIILPPQIILQARASLDRMLEFSA